MSSRRSFLLSAARHAVHAPRRSVHCFNPTCRQPCAPYKRRLVLPYPGVSAGASASLSTNSSRTPFHLDHGTEFSEEEEQRTLGGLKRLQKLEPWEEMLIRARKDALKIKEDTTKA
eukprot:1181538-Rhodomonas_salina.1